MKNKIETFLVNNNLDFNVFNWGQRGFEYIKPEAIDETFNTEFLGKIRLYGDGVILTLFADTEPHTGDYIVEMQLEDFKHGNHTWSRL